MDKSLSYKGLSLHTSSGTSYLILFIIWPFLAFLIALANYTHKEARTVIFFFLVYFGLTFVSDNELMDSFRYVETWRFYASLPFSDIFRAVTGYYSYSSSVDFMEPLVAFLISRITESHHIFFAVFAGIFAFFYLRSYNLLFDQYKNSPNWNSWVFMIFTLVVIPITSLSVLRMWIAAWIFFFGTFQVLQTHKFKYVLLALTACLVHWSFISIGLLLIGYYFAGNRRLIYTPLAIGSFFISQFLNPILEFVALTFGGGIGARVEGYTSEAHAIIYQDWQASNSWFLSLSQNLIWYFFIIAIIIIRVFKRDMMMKSKLQENWYNFLLLLFTLVNLGRRIPDFGMRMQSIFILFASVYVFFYFNNLAERKLRFLTVLGLFPILLYTLIQFRIGADSINAWLFAPGFGLPLLDPGLSLIEVLLK
jgi:hypothetical protein